MNLQNPPPARATALPHGVMDRLMPMHLCVDDTGLIRHAGPTIRKMSGRDRLDDIPLLELFEIRRPAGIAGFDDLMGQAGRRLSLALDSARQLPLRGVILPVADAGGAVLDMSLGLSFARAVADFSLTLADFSPTDQTIELLYLNEAKASTTRLSEHLSERLQAAHAAAQFQARTDVLTGLSNRRAMDDELQRLLASQTPDFSLLHIDLDLFKTVNDTHGHAAGDAVLVEVGRILDRELRRNDFPARVGGDEFLVILRPAQDTATLARIAGRLIDRIEQPIAIGAAKVRISASIGLASTPQYDSRPTAERLMADVDSALYRAKNGGRGRFAIHGHTGK